MLTVRFPMLFYSRAIRLLIATALLCTFLSQIAEAHVTDRVTVYCATNTLYFTHTSHRDQSAASTLCGGCQPVYAPHDVQSPRLGCVPGSGVSYTKTLLLLSASWLVVLLCFVASNGRLGLIGCFLSAPGLYGTDHSQMKMTLRNFKAAKMLNPTSWMARIWILVAFLYGFSASGACTQFAEVYHPAMTSLTLDSFGMLYFSHATNNLITGVNLATGLQISYLTLESSGSALSVPSGLCTDTYSNLYIADAGNNCIVKLNTTTGLQIGKT